MMTRISLAILAIVLLSLGACKPTPAPVEVKEEPKFFYGGDFSVLKKLEDHGGVYTFDGKKVDALELFAANGYNYGRVRIFHTPNMEGPVCNSLDYTIELSKKIKAAGMRLLLDFHCGNVNAHATTFSTISAAYHSSSAYTSLARNTRYLPTFQ